MDAEFIEVISELCPKDDSELIITNFKQPGTKRFYSWYLSKEHLLLVEKSEQRSLHSSYYFDSGAFKLDHEPSSEEAFQRFCQKFKSSLAQLKEQKAVLYKSS